MAICLVLAAIIVNHGSQGTLLAQRATLDVRDKPTLEVIADFLKERSIPFEMRGNAPGATLATTSRSTGSYTEQPIAYILERLLEPTEPAIFFREFEGKVVFTLDRYVSVDPKAFSRRDPPTYRDILDRMAFQAKVKIRFDESIRKVFYDSVPETEWTAWQNVPFHRAMRKILSERGAGYVRNSPDDDYHYTVCRAGTLDKAFLGTANAPAAGLKLVVGSGTTDSIATAISPDKSGVIVLGDNSIVLHSAFDGVELARRPLSGGKSLRVGANTVAVHQEGAIALFSGSLASQIASIPIQRDQDIDYGFAENLLFVRDSERGRLYHLSGGSWSEITGLEGELGSAQFSILPLPASKLLVLQAGDRWVAYETRGGTRVGAIAPLNGAFAGDGALGAVWYQEKTTKGRTTAVTIRWLMKGGGSVSNIEWKASGTEDFEGATVGPDGVLNCYAVRSGRKPQLATYRVAPGKPTGAPTLKEFARLSEARRAARQTSEARTITESEESMVKATLDAVSAQIVNRIVPNEIAPMPKSSRMLFRFNHDQIDWFDPATGGRMFTPILLRPKWGDKIGRFDESTSIWIARDQGPSAYERLIGEKLDRKEDGLDSENRPTEGRARTILLAKERTRLVTYIVDIEGSMGRGVGICLPISTSPVTGEVLAIAENGTRIVVDITPKVKLKAGEKAPERLFQVQNTTSHAMTGPIFRESEIVGQNGQFGKRIDVVLSPDGQAVAFRSPEGAVIFLVDGRGNGLVVDGEAAKSSTGFFKFDRTGRFLVTSKPQGAPGGDETIIREVGGSIFARLPAYMAIGDRSGNAFAVLANAGVAIYRPGTGFDPNSLQRIPLGESIVTAQFSDSDRYLYLLTSRGMLQVWKAGPLVKLVNFVALSGGNFVTFNERFEYMASRGGAQAVSFQSKNEQISFDSFDLTLNRPDVILGMLESATQNVVRLYARARSIRLRKHWEDILAGGGQRDVAKITPPSIKISLPLVSESSQREMDVPIDVSDEAHDLARVDVYVNGVPIYGKTGIVPGDMTRFTKTEKVRLSDDLNIIEVAATNKMGVRSTTVQRRVRCTAPSEQPELYVVAIGTPEYDQLPHLPGTSADVDNLVAYFKAGAGLVSGPEKVHIAAYPKSIKSRRDLKEIGALLSKAKQDDIIVFFYSGHGANAETGLYFPLRSFDRFTCPVTPDDEDVPIIHISDIEGFMDSTLARQKLVLIDSCQSGETTPEAFRSSDNLPLTVVLPPNPGDKAVGAPGLINAGPIDVVEIMKSSFNDLRRGTGAITLAAASASQAAREDVKGGVFAQAVLRGLKGEADTSPRDKKVTVNELYEFVTVQVVVQSKGTQRPTARSENIRNNFALSRLK